MYHHVPQDNSPQPTNVQTSRLTQEVFNTTTFPTQHQNEKGSGRQLSPDAF